MHDLPLLLTELARRIAEDDRGEPFARRLCRAAADLLGCEGGALTLGHGADARMTLAVTDSVAEALESAQEVVQQGPGTDAFTSSRYQRLVVGPDGGRDARWPLLDLRHLIEDRPVVIHAVPVRQRASTVGVLTLWERERPTALDPESAELVAGILAAALSERLEQEDGALVESWAERAEIHQAAGFVVAQLGLPVDDALALLRAQAYVRGTTMTQTARDVIQRRLTFREEPEDGIQAT
ncbi:ANTAR domain-containing protein [Oryzobacter sp. R7]|uniref:ANTAR domain-containing protein n=1 Tax=Oryzobacter faecalis TaxID=3388656 RepID=UPI00398CB2A0